MYENLSNKVLEQYEIIENELELMEIFKFIEEYKGVTSI